MGSCVSRNNIAGDDPTPPRKKVPCMPGGSSQTAPEPKQLTWPAGEAQAEGAQVMTMKEINAATDNFSPKNLLGQGWFGRVYKGRLPHSRRTVAVKRLGEMSSQQGNIEFRTEVAMLGMLQHPNLVTLYGYCADGAERVLVYEYMEGGSLDRHLHDRPKGAAPLDWIARVSIALDVARGLCHLHEGTEVPIIYRDFKTSNILLTKDLKAKVSDFGLARAVPIDQTHLETRVMGTWGYVAPEYMLKGRLTQKSDIYSFGVVLLELISGRRAIDKSRPKNDIALTRWANRIFRSDQEGWVDIVDPALKGSLSSRDLRQALTITFMCLQEEPSHRPLASDTVRALEQLLKSSKGASRSPSRSPRSSGDSGVLRVKGTPPRAKSKKSKSGEWRPDKSFAREQRSAAVH